jgi:hypothetical protein
MIHSIKESEYRPLPSTVSPFIQKLMNQFLNKILQERPDASTILCMKEIEPIKKKIFA